MPNTDGCHFKDEPCVISSTLARLISDVDSGIKQMLEVQIRKCKATQLSYLQAITGVHIGAFSRTRLLPLKILLLKGKRRRTLTK